MEKKLKLDNQITKKELPGLFEPPQEADKFRPLHMPRHYSAEQTSETSLHIFSEELQEALASVAYFFLKKIRPKVKNYICLRQGRSSPFVTTHHHKNGTPTALFVSRLSNFEAITMIFPDPQLSLKRWQYSLQRILGSDKRQQLLLQIV